MNNFCSLYFYTDNGVAVEDNKVYSNTTGTLITEIHCFSSKNSGTINQDKLYDQLMLNTSFSNALGAVLNVKHHSNSNFNSENNLKIDISFRAAWAAMNELFITFHSVSYIAITINDINY